MGQQQQDQLLIPRLRGDVESRLSARNAGVHIGTTFEQGFDGCLVLLLHSHNQRSGCVGPYLRVRACGNQKSDHLGIPGGAQTIYFWGFPFIS